MKNTKEDTTLVSKEVSSQDQTLDRQTADDIANTQDLDVVMQTVIVERDPMTKVSTEVMDHEIPILNAIHGEENVRIVGSRKVKVTDINAGGEYDRLVRKYERSTDTGDIVRLVYGGNPRDLADEMGLPYKTQRGNRQARAQQGALVIVGGESESEILPTTAVQPSITSKTASTTTEPANSQASREGAAAARAAIAARAAAARAAQPAPAAKPVAKAKAKARK